MCVCVCVSECERMRVRVHVLLIHKRAVHARMRLHLRAVQQRPCSFLFFFRGNSVHADSCAHTCTQASPVCDFTPETPLYYLNM